MRREIIPSRYTVSGLRTRFFPKSRIGQGLIALAPWLNVVLLVMFYVHLTSLFVLQPGYVVEMPEAPFADGVRPLVTAVVLSFERTQEGGREEVVFFDDVRFEIQKEKHVERLRQAVGEYVQQHPDTALTILADSRVRYGTLVQLLNLARDLGIEKVNMAYRERIESKAGR